MVILKWLADEFAAPMVCHLHAFASACESGAVRAGEVIDSEHDQPLLAHKRSQLTANTTPPIALRSMPFGWHNVSSCIGLGLALTTALRRPLCFQRLVSRLFWMRQWG